MARIDDLKLTHRLFLRRYAYERFVTTVAVPRLTMSLGEATVALVTTGGLHMVDQVPFDGGVRGGDCSFRVVPDTVDGATLRCAHKSDAFDHSGVTADPETALPLSALHGLVGTGMIGRASSVHLSYMGSITKPEPLIHETAPEGARCLVEAGVDVALLVPL